MHATFLSCGEFPNRKTLDNECTYEEYGNIFDIMGDSNFVRQYGLRNKLIALGWLEENEISETTEGTYFISPFEENMENNIRGLKIPID